VAKRVVRVRTVSRSLGNTAVTLASAEVAARARPASPNCWTMRAPSTSAWISSRSNISGGRS
jgi:hypothetical protein